MTPHHIAAHTRILLMTAAPLVWVAFGAATASAEPREWDIEEFDQCMETARDADEAFDCCEDSGGITGEYPGECEAPAANPAEEAERAPAPTAIPFPETEATLWFPPPPPPNPSLPVEPSLSTR